MPPSSQRAATSGRQSPGAEEPEFDDEEIAEERPAIRPAKISHGGASKISKKKKKKKTPLAPVAVAPAPAPVVVVRKKAKRAPEPVVEEPEEDVEDEAEDEAEVGDYDAACAVIKEFRGKTRKLPTSEELAEAMGCGEDSASGYLLKYRSKQTARTRARKAKKAAGYGALAIAAGMGVKGSNADDAPMLCRGYDSHVPVLTMQDCVRLSRVNAMTPDQPSYDADEFALRAELAHTTTLPESAAREIQAHADAFFKYIVGEAVRITMQQKSLLKVKPSAVLAAVKKFAPHMMFTAITPPPGLVMHGKQQKILGEGEKDRAMFKDFKKSASVNMKVAKTWRLQTNKIKEENTARRDAAKALRLSTETPIDVA